MNTIAGSSKRLHGQHVSRREGCQYVGEPESFRIALVYNVSPHKLTDFLRGLVNWYLSINIDSESESRFRKFPHENSSKEPDRVSRKLFCDLLINIKKTWLCRWLDKICYCLIADPQFGLLRNSNDNVAVSPGDF